jgi:hypothetical protein
MVKFDEWAKTAIVGTEEIKRKKCLLIINTYLLPNGIKFSERITMSPTDYAVRYSFAFFPPIAPVRRIASEAGGRLKVAEKGMAIDFNTLEAAFVFGLNNSNFFKQWTL